MLEMQETGVQSLGGKWQLTPVFLHGKFHGHRGLALYSPQDPKESDTTEHHYHYHHRVHKLACFYPIFSLFLIYISLYPDQYTFYFLYIIFSVSFCKGTQTQNAFLILLFSSVIHISIQSFIHIILTRLVKLTDKNVKIEFSLKCERFLQEGVTEL